MLNLKDENGIEYVGLGMHFDELPVGRKFRTVGRTITESDLVNFVNSTGFTEVLFTDTQFIREESDIKGRPVPGALVYCMAEGLLMQSTMQHTGFAFLEMSLQVKAPTIVGDRIYVTCEVIEARPSRSRSDRGLVRTMNRVINQHGVVIMTYDPLRFVKRLHTTTDKQNS